MQVAFLSEGPTELGCPSGARDDLPWERSFALKALVERILGCPGQIQPCEIPRRGAGAGTILKHGYAYLRDAARQGAQAAVVVVDADGKAHERLRILREQRDKVYSKDSRLFIPTAAGIAVDKIEAWLLADEAALCRVLGLDAPTRPAGSPEDLKGKRGAPDDPKTRLGDYLRLDRGGPRSFLDQVNAIVAELDLDVLARQCPKGFAPFREEVLRDLGPLFASPTSDVRK